MAWVILKIICELMIYSTKQIFREFQHRTFFETWTNKWGMLWKYLSIVWKNEFTRNCFSHKTRLRVYRMFDTCICVPTSEKKISVLWGIPSLACRSHRHWQLDMTWGAGVFKLKESWGCSGSERIGRFMHICTKCNLQQWETVLYIAISRSAFWKLNLLNGILSWLK